MVFSISNSKNLIYKECPSRPERDLLENLLYNRESLLCPYNIHLPRWMQVISCGQVRIINCHTGDFGHIHVMCASILCLIKIDGVELINLTTHQFYILIRGKGSKSPIGNR